MLSSSLRSWLFTVLRISPVGWNNERGTADNSYDNTAFRSISRWTLAVNNLEKRTLSSFRIAAGSFCLDTFNGLFSSEKVWRFIFLTFSKKGVVFSTKRAFTNWSVAFFPMSSALMTSLVKSPATIWPEIE